MCFCTLNRNKLRKYRVNGEKEEKTFNLLIDRRKSGNTQSQVRLTYKFNPCGTRPSEIQKVVYPTIKEKTEELATNRTAAIQGWPIHFPE